MTLGANAPHWKLADYGRAGVSGVGFGRVGGTLG